MAFRLPRFVTRKLAEMGRPLIIRFRLTLEYIFPVFREEPSTVVTEIGADVGTKGSCNFWTSRECMELAVAPESIRMLNFSAFTRVLTSSGDSDIFTTQAITFWAGLSADLMPCPIRFPG